MKVEWIQQKRLRVPPGTPSEMQSIGLPKYWPAPTWSGELLNFDSNFQTSSSYQTHAAEQNSERQPRVQPEHEVLYSWRITLGQVGLDWTNNIIHDCWFLIQSWYFPFDLSVTSTRVSPALVSCSSQHNLVSPHSLLSWAELSWVRDQTSSQISARNWEEESRGGR